MFCENCQAVLNNISKLARNVWKCEFCSYSNQLKDKAVQLPTSSDVFYVLEEPKIKEAKQPKEEKKKKGERSEIIQENIDYEDKRTIVFCLDNSGSMSSGSVVADNEGNKKYVSRKKCVENALEAQIAQMKSATPNRKVGLVLFSTQITVLGNSNILMVEFGIYVAISWGEGVELSSASY